VRRAAAFAVVSLLSLAAPVLGRAVAVPFALVALAAFAVTDGPAFDLFAFPSDRREGRLHGLASFCLAAAGIGLLLPVFGLPASVFVATVLVVGFGDLGRQAVATRSSSDIAATTGFAAAGFAAAALGQVGVLAADGRLETGVLPDVVFLASSGALLAALLYVVFVERDDALVMAAVALLLWLFADIAVEVSATRVGVALAVTVALGYASWTLDLASVAGMVTGVLLSLLAIVLGGYGWFAVLIAFFGVGGLSTKYRYEEKRDRGVAEERGGARGSGNVLGNSAAALVALLLFAASPKLPVGGELFRYAFAGSVATALSDTLSSEIGGLYDRPRLVTTLERVEPGTDGGVTWQGELAGVAGAAVIAGVAFYLLDVGGVGVAVVVLAGLAGMTADSLLGATLEGGAVGNQAVNFLATVVGAVAGGVFALALGVVSL
jgi:uncharacterized protein (TIGR00297 family)